MKIVLSALAAMALLTALILNHTVASVPARSPDEAIRVVAGREPSVPPQPDRSAVAEVAGQGAMSAPVVIDDAANGPIKLDPTPLNLAQTDETFNAQHRDPQWAGHIESIVAGQLPDNGSIACAEFMCKVAVPMTDDPANMASDSDVDMADHRAALMTKAWPTEIAYNQQTARTVSGPNGPMLTFLVTRADWDANQ